MRNYNLKYTQALAVLLAFLLCYQNSGSAQRLPAQHVKDQTLAPMIGRVTFDIAQAQKNTAEDSHTEQPMSIVTNADTVLITLKNHEKISISKKTIAEHYKPEFDTEGINTPWVEKILYGYAMQTNTEVKYWNTALVKREVAVDKIHITQPGIILWRALYFFTKSKKDMIAWLTEKPIKVILSDGIYYCTIGNHRLLYCKIFGIKKIPCEIMKIRNLGPNSQLPHRKFRAKLSDQATHVEELFGHQTVNAFIVDFLKQLKLYRDKETQAGSGLLLRSA